MCGSVKVISYVPLELNKLKHFGDVYVQIIFFGVYRNKGITVFHSLSEGSFSLEL